MVPWLRYLYSGQQAQHTQTVIITTKVIKAATVTPVAV